MIKLIVVSREIRWNCSDSVCTMVVCIRINLSHSLYRFPSTCRLCGQIQILFQNLFDILKISTHSVRKKYVLNPSLGSMSGLAIGPARRQNGGRPEPMRRSLTPLARPPVPPRSFAPSKEARQRVQMILHKFINMS